MPANRKTTTHHSIIASMEDALSYGRYIDSYFGRICKQYGLDYNVALSAPLDFIELAMMPSERN